MAIAATVAPLKTVADLLERLDGIPANRIRIHPEPGTATEADLLRVLDHENIICELVDGTLVEKPMGYGEGQLTVELLYYLTSFLRIHNLGLANGPDGTLRLTSGLLRVPDISFVSWDRLPDRKRPLGPVPMLTPDLAIEILSKSNTRQEMDRKLGEYFDSGVLAVWLIDPKTRTAQVFSSPEESSLLTEADSLDGGTILPGFRLGLHELFEAANRGPDA